MPQHLVLVTSFCCAAATACKPAVVGSEGLASVQRQQFLKPNLAERDDGQAAAKEEAAIPVQEGPTFGKGLSTHLCCFNDILLFVVCTALHIELLTA